MKPPEYFSLTEMADFYSELSRVVPYPERPVKPTREQFKNNASFGAKLDHYEEVLMVEYKNAISAYRQKQSDIEAEFKAELLKKLEIEGHPKAEKLYAMAWDRGHSHGLTEVAIVADHLVELIKD